MASGYGNVSYPGGGTVRINAGTQADALAGLLGGGGGVDISGLLDARNRAKEEDMLRRLREQQLLWQQQLAQDRSQVKQTEAPSDYERKMQDLALQERQAEVAAKTQRPQMQLIPGGFNNPARYVEDTRNLNAFQRQAYLPQKAELDNSPTRTELAQGENDASFNNLWANQTREHIRARG